MSTTNDNQKGIETPNQHSMSMVCVVPTHADSLSVRCEVGSADVVCTDAFNLREKGSLTDDDLAYLECFDYDLFTNSEKYDAWCDADLSVSEPCEIGDNVTLDWEYVEHLDPSSCLEHDPCHEETFGTLIVCQCPDCESLQALFDMHHLWELSDDDWQVSTCKSVPPVLQSDFIASGSIYSRSDLGRDACSSPWKLCAVTEQELDVSDWPVLKVVPPLTSGSAKKKWNHVNYPRELKAASDDVESFRSWWNGDSVQLARRERHVRKQLTQLVPESNTKKFSASDKIRRVPDGTFEAIQRIHAALGRVPSEHRARVAMRRAQKAVSKVRKAARDRKVRHITKDFDECGLFGILKRLTGSPTGSTADNLATTFRAIYGAEYSGICDMLSSFLASFAHLVSCARSALKALMETVNVPLIVARPALVCIATIAAVYSKSTLACTCLIILAASFYTQIFGPCYSVALDALRHALEWLSRRLRAEADSSGPILEEKGSYEPIHDLASVLIAGLCGFGSTLKNGVVQPWKGISETLCKFKSINTGIKGISDVIQRCLEWLISSVKYHLFGDKEAVDALTDNEKIRSWMRESRAFLERNRGATPTPGLAMQTRALCLSWENIMDEAEFKSVPGVVTSACTEMFKELSVLRKSMARFEPTQRLKIDPVVLFMYSPPGVGKSTLFPQIVAMLARLVFPDMTSEEFSMYADSFCHVRAPENEFWDGYKHEMVTAFDDFAQKKSQEGSTEAFEVIRCANAFKYHLHMSDVKDKAHYFFSSLFLILNSNVPVPSVSDTLVEPRAFYRRMGLCVQTIVKPEYATPAGHVDKDKCVDLPIGTEIHEFYEYKVNALLSKDRVQGISLTGRKFTIAELALELYQRLLLADRIAERNHDSAVAAFNHPSLIPAVAEARERNAPPPEAVLDPAGFGVFFFRSKEDGPVWFEDMTTEVSPNFFEFQRNISDREPTPDELRKAYHHTAGMTESEFIPFMSKRMSDVIMVMRWAFGAKPLTNTVSVNYGGDCQSCVDCPHCAVYLWNATLRLTKLEANDPTGSVRVRKEMLALCRTPMVGGWAIVEQICRGAVPAETRMRFLSLLAGSLTATVCVLAVAFFGMRQALMSRKLKKEFKEKSHAIGQFRVNRGLPAFVPKSLHPGALYHPTQQVFSITTWCGDERQDHVGRGIAIKNDYYLTSDHVVHDIISRPEIDRISLHFLGLKQVVYVSRDDLKRCAEICANLGQLNRVTAFCPLTDRHPMCKDFIARIPEVAHTTEKKTFMCALNLWENGVGNQIQFTTKATVCSEEDFDEGRPFFFVGEPMHKGESGKPMFAFTPTEVHLVGLCQGSFSDYDTVAVSFTRSQILALISALNAARSYKTIELTGDAPGIFVEKSDVKGFRFLTGEKVEPFHLPAKSKMIPTAIGRTSHVSDCGPANLTWYEKDGRLCHPIFDSLDNYPDELKSIDIHKASEFYSTLFARLESLGSLSVDPAFVGREFKRLYTFQEAVAGIDSHFKGIPQSTGVGYPYNIDPIIGVARRRYFFGTGERPDFSRPECVDLQHSVDAVLRSWSKGEDGGYYSSVYLKDELRPTLKKMKTRVIECCNLAVFIANRMLFGGFCDWILRFPGKSGLAVGLNPYSKTMDRVIREVLGHKKSGGVTCAGDAAFFDKRVPWNAKLAQGAAIAHWYDQPEWYVARMAAYECVINTRRILVVPRPPKKPSLKALWDALPETHPFRSVGQGLVARTSPGFGSGTFMTAIGGSLDSMLLNYLPWKGQNADRAPIDYFSDVYGQYCGDDNIFNCASNPQFGYDVAEFYESVGIDYTTADKKRFDRAIPLDVNAVTFLKRSFRYEADPRFRRWVAPLDVQSIYRMIEWTRRGLDLEVQSCAARCALHEAALHGKEFYDSFLHKFSREDVFSSVPKHEWFIAFTNACALDEVF